MRSLYRRCAGLDIHKKSVSVCIRMRARGKPEADIEEAVFGTFTQDLEKLAEWLRQHKVRQIAMESTGVYWRPVWNIPERPKYGFQLTLVNRPRCGPSRAARPTALTQGASPSICNMVCCKAASFLPNRCARSAT